MDNNDYNETNILMSKRVPNQKDVYQKKLEIGDSSFDLFCDVFKGKNKEYLYIKLVENSAVSPFYYNRSFTIDELKNLDVIFNVDNKMENIKELLKGVFEHQKFEIIHDENNESIIILLKAALFEDIRNIKIELIKEMIPQKERDSMLLNLYEIHKKKLKQGKKIYEVLLKHKGKIEPKLFEELKSHFDIVDEPKYLGGVDNQNVDEIEDETLKMLFSGKAKRGKYLEDKKGFVMEFKNKSQIPFPENFIKFKISENSPIICKEIVYPNYEIDVNQRGEFIFIFDEMGKTGEFILNFDVFVGGKKLKDTQFKLKVYIEESD